MGNIYESITELVGSTPLVIPGLIFWLSWNPSIPVEV